MRSATLFVRVACMTVILHAHAGCPRSAIATCSSRHSNDLNTRRFSLAAPIPSLSVDRVTATHVAATRLLRLAGALDPRQRAGHASLEAERCRPDRMPDDKRCRSAEATAY